MALGQGQTLPVGSLFARDCQCRRDGSFLICISYDSHCCHLHQGNHTADAGVDLEAGKGGEKAV